MLRESATVDFPVEADQVPSESYAHKQQVKDSSCVDDKNNGVVYTDSVFWFDSATKERLLSIYENLAPLGVEIDAYGDFLQALGNIEKRI